MDKQKKLQEWAIQEEEKQMIKGYQVMSEINLEIAKEHEQAEHEADMTIQQLVK